MHEHQNISAKPIRPGRNAAEGLSVLDPIEPNRAQQDLQGGARAGKGTGPCLMLWYPHS